MYCVGCGHLFRQLHLQHPTQCPHTLISLFHCNLTSLKLPKPLSLSRTSSCVLPLPSCSLPFFSFFFYPFHSLPSWFLPPVPVQLAEQQHGEPGESRHVRQPLQLREHVFVGRAHPLALLPAQLHLRGPVPGPSNPLQHRLPGSACLSGVLPAVQHRQVRHMDRE